jgi:hypothetical protein
MLKARVEEVPDAAPRQHVALHQNDPVRLAPAVQDEIPYQAVEVRNQRPACVVEAVKDVGRIASELGGPFRDPTSWKQ